MIHERGLVFENPVYGIAALEGSYFDYHHQMNSSFVKYTSALVYDFM